MNRVYKVIWSKAKHCYVVTSEIARSVTKSASSTRSAGRKGAAVLAMAALLFTAGGVLGEAADQANLKIDEYGVVSMVKDDGTEAVKKLVLNKDGENQITLSEDGIKVGKDNTVIGSDSSIKGAGGKFTVGTDGKVTAASGIIGTVEITSAGAVSGVMDLTVSRDVEAVGNLKVGNGNFTVNGITGDVTTGNATIGDALTVKGDTEIGGDLGVKGNLSVEGVFAGGDTADAAKASLNADGSIKGADGEFAVGTDGSIKGADGKFEVNAGGQVTAKGGVNTAGAEINTAGGKITAGAITGTQLNTQGGDIIGGKATVTELTTQGGDISGGDITATGLNTQGGEINGGDIKSSGTIHADDKITGNGLDAGSGAISGGSLSVTGAMEGNSLTLKGGNLDAGSGTITTTGNIKVNNITADGTITTTNLVVNDGLKTDHITLGSDGFNQTDINKGNVTSIAYKNVGGVDYMAESSFNKDGSSITARTNEGSVDSTGNSTVGGKEISQYLGSNAGPDPYGKNVTRRMVRNDDGTFSMEDTAVDGKDKYSTVSQNAGERKFTVTDGTKTLTVTKNLTGGIVSETNDGAENTVTLTQGMDGTYKVETSGASTEDIGGQKIENYKDGLKTEITGDETHHVTENQTTTVTGDSSLSAADIENKASSSIWNHVGERYNTSWKMTDGKISESIVKGTASNKENTTAEGTKRIITNDEGTGTYNQTATSNNISLKNAAEDTSFTKSESLDGEKTSVTNPNGSSTINQSAESIVNFVKNSEGTTKTEQSAKDITNTAKNGTITNDANDVLNKGANSVINEVGANQVAVMTDSVKAAYGSDTYTTWNDKGITSNTSGNMSNRATNITNKATEKLSNSATDIENKASSSIWNHVGEGYNTSWKMTDGKISESIVNGTASNKENTTAEGTKRIITNDEGTGTYNQTATSNNISLKNAAGDTSFTKSESLDGEKTSVTNPKGSSTINQSAESIANFVKNSEGHTTRTEQSAEDITNIARDGTIANDALHITNKADETLSNSAKNITNTASEKIISQIGDGSAVKSEMTADGITNTAEGGTIYNKSKDILNEASGDILNFADGEIGNVATKITNITGKNTVISDNDGTTFANEDAKTPFVKGGEVNTKITGNKVETGKVLTDDLTVRGTSEFVGRADFRNDVYVDENLTVAKETRTDTLYVDHDGYVGGNLNVDGNIETHDAELSADSRQVVTGRQLYQTNERVDKLDNRIKKVGANAAALAALRPGDFNPDDKFSIAAGFGSYRNASAAALGLFYRPNENVILSLGTSFGDGENMVNAGVSVKFGRGKSMAERRKEMAEEVSVMRDEMKSQNDRIAELEEMLKKQSELIEKLSKES